VSGVSRVARPRSPSALGRQPAADHRGDPRAEHPAPAGPASQ